MPRGRGSRGLIATPLRNIRHAVERLASPVPAGLRSLPGLVPDAEHRLALEWPDGRWLLTVHQRVDGAEDTPGYDYYLFARDGGGQRRIFAWDNGRREILRRVEGNEELHCAYAPALVGEKGGEHWYLEGRLHRDGGPAIEEPSGLRTWYQDGKIHRDGGPARELPDGCMEWYRHGLLHRDGGPATEKPKGSSEWYQDGQLHRDGGPARVVHRIRGEEWTLIEEWYQHGALHREGAPAIERSDGLKEWYEHGVQHREDGPAVEGPGGRREWRRAGLLHREDGPAMEKDGSQFWLQNDQIHRTDGPAVIHADGSVEWWIRGQRVSEAIFNRFHGGGISAPRGVSRVADAMNRR